MIKGAQLRHVAVLVLTLLCSGGMLLACAANKSGTPSEVDEVEIKTTDPLNSFEEEYAAIRRKAEDGAFSADVMGRATEIRVGLQKYLLKTEAELEILRLDVLHGAEAQREKALSQIFELVAEREQAKMSCWQQLQELRNGSETSAGKTEEKGTTQELDSKIDISPEDITDGERP